MKISVGSDHRGVSQRAAVGRAIVAAGHEYKDCGASADEPCDYPDIAAVVAKKIVAGESNLGVLLCGTGIGVSIAANKVHGIRAALCDDEQAAELSRKHNDANVLCLSAAKSEEQLEAIVTAWLGAVFEGGRHERRVNKIIKLEG